jgi:hypothetical protein
MDKQTAGKSPISEFVIGMIYYSIIYDDMLMEYSLVKLKLQS